MDIIIRSGMGRERVMSESDRRVVWNALVVAAREFDKSEEVCRETAELAPSTALGCLRLAEQFKKQAKEARDLIETFE